jgi:hypothetical protein
VVAGYGCVHVSAIGCGAVLYCAVLLAAYVVVQRVGTVAGSQAGRSESDFRCCKRNDTIRYDTIRCGEDERGNGETLVSRCLFEFIEGLQKTASKHE